MAAMKTWQGSLAAYRTLMRARETVFKNDMEMLVQSRVAIRTEFMKNANVTDEAQLKELVFGAEDAANFMLHQLVQGQKKADGEYELHVNSRHVTMDPNKLPGQP